MDIKVKLTGFEYITNLNVLSLRGYLAHVYPNFNLQNKSLEHDLLTQLN
jgi:hypothetical protein